eukprot:gene46219-56590_t
MASMLSKSGVNDAAVINDICKEWESIRSQQLTPQFVLLQKQQSQHQHSKPSRPAALADHSARQDTVWPPSDAERKPAVASSQTQTSSIDANEGMQVSTLTGVATARDNDHGHSDHHLSEHDEAEIERLMSQPNFSVQDLQGHAAGSEPSRDLRDAEAVAELR